MDTQANVLQVYRELADCYEARGEEALRDRFLVLAADAAWTAGQHNEAELLRQRLLQRNRNHLLKAYRSFGDALRVGDVKLYLHELRKSHPPEAAREQLERLRGQGTPPPPEGTLPPNFPPTAPDVHLHDDPTWLPDMTGPAAGSGFNLEATADLEATAALGDLTASPDRLERTEHLPPPGPAGGRAAGRDRPLTRPAPAAQPPAQARPAGSGRSMQPAKAPAPPAPVAPVPRTPASPPPPPAETNWFALLLGIVTLLVGLGLLGFILLRPFLDRLQP
jgi:hypothetical protein